MRILGAILAGGEARRFGSDKAEALIGGERLIDRVAAALNNQCDGVIVCGREDPAFTCVPDQPEAGMGPLGGLNAALARATSLGFSAVLSAPCDVPDLPENLARLLQGDRPAYVEDQPVVGLWPAATQEALAAYLSNGRRSLYGFAETIKARPVALDSPLMNINRPQDLP